MVIIRAKTKNDRIDLFIKIADEDGNVLFIMSLILCIYIPVFFFFFSKKLLKSNTKLFGSRFLLINCINLKLNKMLYKLIHYLIFYQYYKL